MSLDPRTAAAGVIFVGTYAVVAIGKLPGFLIDRAGAAILGAALMVAAGALSVEEAYRAVDLGTLALLLGMMLIVAHLRLAGFFDLVTRWAAARARHPLLLLAMIVLISGGLSAVLVNDAVCVAMTPLVLSTALALRLDPAPFALALAMAANVGSVATPTGNPQNMLIASMSGIGYGHFAAALTPVAAIGLAATFLLVAALHPRQFLVSGGMPVEADPRGMPVHRALAVKSLLAAIGVLVALFAGVPPPEAALAGGGLLLLIGRVRPAKVWRSVDWPLLVMFAGLFVVVAGFERSVLTGDVLAFVRGLGLERPVRLAAVTAVLSNLVSNVPAVLVLRPFVEKLPNVTHAWLLVAMASTLAGNLTLVGSVANLIVAQQAGARGVHIGFWRYARVGVPVTAATLAAGVLWMGRG